MHDIEVRTHIIFHLEHGVCEGAAHIIDVVDEIVGALERDPVVVHPVNLVVLPVTLPAHAGKDMHLMAFALQCRGKFGHMNGDAAHGYRMQRFPR